MNYFSKHAHSTLNSNALHNEHENICESNLTSVEKGILSKKLFLTFPIQLVLRMYVHVYEYLDILIGYCEI